MAQPLHLPRSGDEREDRAIAIAAAVTSIFAAAESFLVAAIASAVRKAVMGGSAAVTGERLARQAAVVIATAEKRAERVIAAEFGTPPEGIADMLQFSGGNAFQAVEQVYQQAVTAGLTASAAPAPAAEAGSPYAAAIARALAETRGGIPASSISLSRIQAAQKALDELLAKGITGFTDRAGRNWDLASYVEMATRTAVSNTYDGLMTRAMTRSGLDLVLVTHGSEPVCDHCAPFLDHLLSLSGGTTGRVTVTDSAGGTRSAVVVATVGEAKAAGWRHPNCRCGMVIFHDGANFTEADLFVQPSPEQMAADYRNEQRQRALERRVRAAGRRQQAAITPQARSQARRELADARKASADHRAAHAVRQTKVGVRRREHPFRAH